MTHSQIEAWVLDVVDAVVERKGRVEDNRVELKAQWPDPARAARRLAAHCNAAVSDVVLWVIGLDESAERVNTPSPDLAIWYPQVASQFDGLAPTVIDLQVPTPHGAVHALVFDVSRRPYVVKNPAYGRTKGEVVSWEVPWREATSVRSATRSELVKILVPHITSPEAELLSATASLHDAPAFVDKYGEQVDPARFAPHLIWTVKLELYVVPRSAGRVVLPVHRSRVSIQTGGISRQLQQIKYFVPYVHYGSGVRADSQTISRTNAEAILDGPGVLQVEAELIEPVTAYESANDTLIAQFAVRPAPTAAPLALTCEMRRTEPAHSSEHLERFWSARVASGA